MPAERWRRRLKARQYLRPMASPRTRPCLRRMRRKFERLPPDVLKQAQACVIKIASPDISHKSDVGGVHIGLQSATSAEQAAGEMLARDQDRAARSADRWFHSRTDDQSTARARDHRWHEHRHDIWPDDAIWRRRRRRRGSSRQCPRLAAARHFAGSPNDCRDPHRAPFGRLPRSACCRHRQRSRTCSCESAI